MIYLAAAALGAAISIPARSVIWTLTCAAVVVGFIALVGTAT